MVEMVDYCKTIARVPVLDHINVRLEDGRIYGLKGKNGSGKTMLLRAMCGLIRPTSGQLLIDGEPLPRGRFPQGIGVLIENPEFLPGYTCRENLMGLARINNKIDEDEVDEALASVGLNPGDRRPVRACSLGMRQRLGIAAALMESPKLILLDEPVNALDPEGVALVAGLLQKARSRGALVVVACHDSGEIEGLFDQTFLMAEGRLRPSNSEGESK